MIFMKKCCMYLVALLFAVLFLVGCGDGESGSRVRDVVQGTAQPAGTAVQTPPAPVTVPAPAPAPAPTPGVALTTVDVAAIGMSATVRIADGTGWNFGSGFFVCPTGILVTNHHVAVGWNAMTAELTDGRIFNITGYYNYDIGNDLAVLQVDLQGESVPYLLLSDAPVRIGEQIFAVGSPQGEPTTFVDGMVSRMIPDAIRFDIYTVYGMIQHTARIYGGNSGGPIINIYAQVVGINAAGSDRQSNHNWAVPPYRINLAATSQLQPLPMRMPTRIHTPGDTIYVVEFPSVPDFLTVSSVATLLVAGPAADLVVYALDARVFDWVYAYSLPFANWIVDTDNYGALLTQFGFELQWGGFFQGVWYSYYYHPGLDISVRYAYEYDYEILFVSIGYGNAYAYIFHGETGGGAPPATATGLEGEWFVNADVDLGLGYGVHNYDVYIFFFGDGTFFETYEWTHGAWFFDLYGYWHSADGVLTMIYDDGSQHVFTYVIVANVLTLIGADNQRIVMQRQ
jgi:hypothetical protein